MREHGKKYETAAKKRDVSSTYQPRKALEIVKDASGGEIGLCYLPDGRIIEEWTLLRMYDGKAP